jgi:hypothetical protein
VNHWYVSLVRADLGTLASAFGASEPRGRIESGDSSTIPMDSSGDPDERREYLKSACREFNSLPGHHLTGRNP